MTFVEDGSKISHSSGWSVDMYAGQESGTTQSGQFRWLTNDSSAWAEQMRLINGKLGIGQTNPSYKLDVAGTARFTGDITGTLATAAQPNITSVGTLGNTTMSGYIGRSAFNKGFLCGGQANLGQTSAKSNPIYCIGSGHTPTTTAITGMYGIGYSHRHCVIDVDILILKFFADLFQKFFPVVLTPADL